MGARPSLPSATQQEALEQRKSELEHRAALAIQQADVLLVATGAGWSADSGLAIYRDVADVEAYHQRGLTYRDICQPEWLRNDPELFYGFWGGCFNDYRNVTPHEGYRTIQKWANLSFRQSEAANIVRRQLAMADRLRAQPHQQLGQHEDTAAAMPSGGTTGTGYAGAFFSLTSNVDAHWVTSGTCDEPTL